ncbi:MAG: hypothetical protein NY202_02640 [Mollicutes bacterium UO1]
MLTIRYLENSGDANLNSSSSQENTALTEIETILDKLGYAAAHDCCLVNYFQALGFKKDN